MGFLSGLSSMVVFDGHLGKLTVAELESDGPR